MVYPYSEIKAKTRHQKSTIQSIIKQLKTKSGHDKFKSMPKVRLGVGWKVDSRGERALLRHADKNTKDPLIVLETPSKSRK
jgi:hypothetical protein